MKKKSLFFLILCLVSSLFLLQNQIKKTNKKTQIKKTIEEKKTTAGTYEQKKINKPPQSKLPEHNHKPEKKELVSQPTKELKEQDTTIPLSFYILNINQGELIAKQSTSDPQKIKLPWKETRSYLANYLLDNYLVKIESKVTTDENNESWILVSDLNSETIKTYFLETDLSIRSTPEFISVKAEKISFKDEGIDPEESNKHLHPSAISGYQNLNLNESIKYGDTDNQLLGRQKYNLRHDGAINIKDWIIQNDGSSIQEGSEYKIGDIRLVHDDVKTMTRFSAGDVTLPGGGFLDSSLIFGVGASRDYSLQPTYNYNQISSYIITIKKNANIKIFSNKILIERIVKLAGKYDIRDFPVVFGLNEIELEIIYDDGEIERFKFPSFNYSPDLLGEGQSSFNYYVGIPQSATSHIKETNNPIIEASDKYGVSNKVTLGGYTQATHHFSIFGGSLDYAAAIGTIRLENAVSHRMIDENSFGIGTRFSYQYSKGSSNFNLFVERRGLGFYTLGNIIDQNPSLYRISSNFSQKINNNTSVSIAESFGISKDQGTKNPIDLSLGFNKSILSDFQFSSLLKKTIGLINDTSISLQISWRMSESKTLASTYDPIRNNVSATLSDKLGQNIDEQIGGSTGQNQKSISGRLSHLGERLRTNVSLEESFLSNGNKMGNTELDLSTAVAFAGNSVTISSPISNSFVIVESEGKLNKEKIYINDRSSNLFGPPSLTNLTSYQENIVNINSSDIRQGITLKKDSYIVVPTYKSGSLIKLEAESFVSIHGTLVDENDQPLSLISGKITNIADKSKEEFFFTNETGEFFIERLESVDYEIVLFNKTGSKLPIHVPVNFEGVFDCGNLVVKLKNNKVGN